MDNEREAGEDRIQRTIVGDDLPVQRDQIISGTLSLFRRLMGDEHEAHFFSASSGVEVGNVLEAQDSRWNFASVPDLNSLRYFTLSLKRQLLTTDLTQEPGTIEGELSQRRTI